MTTKAIQAPMYLDPKAFTLLCQLSRESRIPRAVLVREAIDDLLKKYAKTLRKGARK